MSILNDKEIRAACLVPTHEFNHDGSPLFVSKVVTDNVAAFYYTETGETLGDSWMNSCIPANEVSDDRKSSFRPGMISPFIPGQVREAEDKSKIVSYGTSSMGYDVRLDRKFKIFTNVYGDVIDPLNMPETMYVDYEGDEVIIPPNSYLLGVTIETFDIPRDILAICLGKSTYARCAAIANVTPIEPGFKGKVVIEVANLSTLPLKIYANQGIAQFLFFRGNPCETSYADRDGKYQNQDGVQTALV